VNMHVCEYVGMRIYVPDLSHVGVGVCVVKAQRVEAGQMEGSYLRVTRLMRQTCVASVL
jgi:hypothetical protein